MINDKNSDLNVLLKNLKPDQFEKVNLMSTISVKSNLLKSNGLTSYMNVDAKITTKNIEHIFLFKQETSSIE